MTYFSTEKKKLEDKIKNCDKIGPGKYDNSTHNTPSKAYAPFGSLSRKVNVVKDAQKNPVGPGQYDISRQLIKPSIVQYENQNCIIVKINDEGSSQFKSGQQRFQAKQISETPGPGAYEMPLKTNEKKRRTKSVGCAVIKMKHLYEHEYKESRKPTLFSDPILVSDKQQKPQKKAKGLVRWDLNKQERFASEPKEYYSEEDRSIMVENFQMQKNKNKVKRQSSFFSSKSVKSCFDEIVYKSSNPYKVELRKMLGFSDDAPGPGTYDPGKKIFVRRDGKFQFFGSTANRFPNSENNINEIGPGHYHSEPKLGHKKPDIKLKKPHNREAKRQQTQTEDESIIGPGAYEIQNLHMGKGSFNSNYNLGGGSFGSKKPRFQNPNNKKKLDTRPEYISFKAQEDEMRKQRIEEQFNYRREALKNKKNAVFLSGSKRDCFEDIQSRLSNPFGNYEVGSADISTKLKKQKQYVQQFADCNMTKPGFMSSVERFKTEKDQEEGHKDCWCRIKQVEKKSIEHQSHMFNSNLKRSGIFEPKKGPAVGQYTKNTTMIKDSFNSRFIKQNQNKTKKIKIWKAKS